MQGATKVKTSEFAGHMIENMGAGVLVEASINKRTLSYTKEVTVQNEFPLRIYRALSWLLGFERIRHA